MFRGAFLLALIAVLSSMTMPFGYMPAKAADGSVILLICDGTAQGPQKQNNHLSHAGMDHAQMDHGAERDSSTHETRCNYATSVAADLPDGIHFEEPDPVILFSEPVRLAILTAIFPPKLPPATGPPAA